MWDSGRRNCVLFIRKCFIEDQSLVRNGGTYLPLKSAFGRQGQASQQGLHNKTLSLKENKVVYGQLHIFMKILY